MPAICTICECTAVETSCKYYSVSYSDNADWGDNADIIICSDCLITWLETNESKVIIIRNIHNILKGNQ